MSSEGRSDPQMEIGHVLAMDVVGYSKLLIREQTELLRRLSEIVRGTAQVRKKRDRPWKVVCAIILMIPRAALLSEYSTHI